MLDIKQVKISEKELEDMLKDNLHLIEEGLKFIDNQIVAGRGPLDILAVDNGGSLVVMELKVVESDDMLVQALDYYDWTLEHIDSVKRMYPRFNVDYEQSPRLILVAPSFSQTLLRRAVYLTMSPELFTFKCLEVDGDRGLVFDPLSLPPPPLPPLGPKPPQWFIDYITNSGAKALMMRARDELQALCGEFKDIEESATQYYIGYKIKGKRIFATLSSTRNYFWLNTQDKDGEWKGFKIQNKNDYDKAMFRARQTYKNLGGQAILEQEIIAEKGAF